MVSYLAYKSSVLSPAGEGARRTDPGRLMVCCRREKMSDAKFVASKIRHYVIDKNSNVERRISRGFLRRMNQNAF